MEIRKALNSDLQEIVAMLADDKLGKSREDFRVPVSPSYSIAFERIEVDANQELMVLVDDSGELIGTFQLSFIQYLTYQGGIRAQIEAVRIRKDKRGLGLGEQLFKWAISRANERGEHLLQLTTDKKRPDAFAFYTKLGFVNSHEGMKMHFNHKEQ